MQGHTNAGILHAKNDLVITSPPYLKPLLNPNLLRKNNAHAIMKINVIYEGDIILDPFCGYGTTLMSLNLTVSVLRNAFIYDLTTVLHGSKLHG